MCFGGVPTHPTLKSLWKGTAVCREWWVSLGVYALLLVVPWLLIAAFIAALLVLVGVTGGAL